MKFVTRQGKWILILILLLVFYQALRLQFLIWNWSQFKNQSLTDIGLAFIYGLRFDLAASLFTLSPWILLGLIPWGVRGHRLWLSKLSGFVLGLVCLVFWVFNYFDIEFINFVGRRLTWAGFFLLREKGGTQSVLDPYKYWILAEVIILSLWTWLFWRAWTLPLPNSSRFKTWKSQSVVALAVLSFFIVGTRGGLQKKPLNYVHANLFQAPFLNNLVLNSSFTVLKSLKKESLPREVFFKKPDELKSLLNGTVSTSSLFPQKVFAKKPNIVFIILESFALEYMGSVNHQKGFTPFLDQLSQESLFLTNAFANGRRSIEGIASIYTGIPAMMDEPFISSEFGSNYFLGLGTILQKQGYHTSFFHGAENGSMYFDTFMKSAGVENYFGSLQYPHPQDHDGAWGIYDGPFLSFMADQLAQFPEPFFSGVFTLSSHPPYKIPESLRSQFPAGPIDIAASIGYTDDSLKKFFQKIQNQPWFENTVFVITADHTQMNYLPEYNNILGRYRVPILFYSKKIKWPQLDPNALAQHIDILPTILDMLKINVSESIWLGRSIFKPGEKTISLYLEPGYALVAQDYFLSWQPPQEPVLFRVDNPNAAIKTENFELKKHLEDRLKASIQYFSEGLWDQKMYYPVK